MSNLHPLQSLVLPRADAKLNAMPEALKQVTASLVLATMSDEDFIQKIRNRVAQCRQLALYVADEHTRRVLMHMADEGEADLRKFEADHHEQDNERREG